MQSQVVNPLNYGIMGLNFVAKLNENFVMEIGEATSILMYMYFGIVKK